MNTNSRIYTILFTFIYTFVFIFLLTFVYILAKDKIITNQTLFQKKALLNAMGISYSSDEEAVEQYNSKISMKNAGENEIYSATVNGETVHLLIFTGKGLWGTIEGALSVNSDVSKIKGLDIISHAETPGLGGRIEEKWFLDQFRNENITDNGITFTKGEGNYTESDSRVDAITGATRTSEALQDMINETLSTFQELETGGEL